jgi:hypothetical protein
VQAVIALVVAFGLNLVPDKAKYHRGDREDRADLVSPAAG